MQSIAGNASDSAVRTAAWHVIPLLAVGYIVSYIDRANVGFAALTMNRDLCEAGFYPGVMFYLSTWFPSEVRARVFAWFNVANPMSSVISGPVSAALLKMNGVGGLAGWRWLLLCEGLPACALGLYTLYALPDRPRDARWLTDEQKDALEKRLAEESHPSASRDVWAALRDPRVLILTFSYFCLIVGVLGITLWLPQMLKQRGLTTTVIGFTSAFPYLVASIGMIAWSFHIDRSRAFPSPWWA